MSTVSKPVSNDHRYGISLRNLFIRNQFWPLLIPSITVLFCLFSSQVCSALKIPTHENPDRTVAKLSPRDLQLIKTNQQPFYSHEHKLYVITVDGKITAIDARANGRQVWTADTGSPLIDSSMSKIEIAGDPRSVRLIPSLIGGLYAKYEDDGHVEPLTFDAEALLDSSFKLHDDLVVTGGKHIDTLGLDMHTGQILYSFAKDQSKDSRTNTDANNSRGTLVVKRTTQTVRARSARNGFEKWNFSVSNHELLQFHGSPSNIVVEPADHHEYISPFTGYFVYQLQTGVVQAFADTGEEVWSSTVNSPIAAVWELKNGQLKEKSLFETSSALSSTEEEPTTPPANSRRLAFVGEFNATPYVIVSPRVQKQLIYDARRIAGFHHRRRGLSPWQKAYQKRTVYIDGDSSENHHQRTIGMEVSDGNYPLALRPDSNSNHPSASTLKTCDTAGYLELSADLTDEDDEQKDDQISPKPNTTGALIATTVTLSSVVLGAFFLGLLFYHKQKTVENLRQNSTMTETTLVSEPTPPSTPEYHQIEPPTPTASFQSRYTLEYEHVRFLGRGGFGVVFEAINKLDERRVAIKRVSLKKTSGKERALKEIRYLAVLNHPNLIQYYYAWNESPPPGWQEEEDKILLARHNQSARDSISSFPTSGNDSESIHREKSLFKPPVISPSPLIDFTFDRSSNPLRIQEDFSNQSLSQAATSDMNSSSEDHSDRNHLDPNNNRSTKRMRSSTTTKSSISSSSPMFDHSTSSDDDDDDDEDDNGDVEHRSIEKEITDESDGGILFLPDEKRSSTDKSESKSIVERKPTEKDVPPTYFYFVMELCQPESLRDRLIQRSIDRVQAWSIFDQIVRGIEYIHSQKLIHRDLKPSNILFSLDNTVRIGDFGLVSAFGEEKSSKKKDRIEKRFQIDTSDAGGNDEVGGTVLYMSPEQINHEPYNQKVDIYAMGIILFELLYPFSTQMERMRAINDVRSKYPIFPADFEKNQFICQFIRWLLSYSSRERPRASELRDHKIYQKILQEESPQLVSLCDPRQTHSTLVHSAETLSTVGRVRKTSSPLHRSHSSFNFPSHRDLDSNELKNN